ncbi:nicotinate-nucleotide adenylyltransferase [Alphaproteobacteria bacterium SO-S41]|nr:nicotinate-nucleotide adenylyltransferase [Alphaproteobacteria bacterium SO-S41]
MTRLASRAIAPPSRLRVGLFGGSFNPPHQGHRHASLVALRRLELDAVWWLVTPGNPLKNQRELAPLEQRLKASVDLENHPRIHVTTLESSLGTRFTADTLKAIAGRFPAINFVWIMGADNLATIHKWRAWRQIFQTMPIVAVARPGYTLKALSSPAARAFAASRIDPDDAALLPFMHAPAWTYLDDRLDPASSTAIRARGLWPVGGV